MFLHLGLSPLVAAWRALVAPEHHAGVNRSESAWALWRFFMRHPLAIQVLARASHRASL